ncbi:MAG: protein-disulfide reductase DsbD domain-containing protein [Verrucomicrobiota bacterium]
MRYRTLPFVLLILLSAVGRAEPVQAVHTTIELLAEQDAIVPGETFHLAVRFEQEPNWHIYWVNPGASGLPPEITWKLPAGFEVGAIQWPIPQLISLEGLVSYGYKDVVSFIVPVKAPAELKPGTVVDIRAEIFYLICNELCLPGDAVVDLALPVGKSSGPSEATAVFKAGRASQPSSEMPFEVIASRLEEQTLFVEITGQSLPESLYFFAEAEGMIDPNPAQIYTVEGEVAQLALPMDFLFFEGDRVELEGVLAGPETSWRVSIPPLGTTPDVPAADAKAVQTSGGLEQRLLDLGLFGWLILAFSGGVILNVMPCVLPVLSLKVFSLLNHGGQSRAQAMAHGIAYTLGVVFSFLILAGVLFALRALGDSIGWGFQLQNPGFVLVLAVVFFLFGLNLMGVFEIGSSLVGADAKVAGRKDLFGSFGVGVLAAVVGAPCVGPFVGGVSGVALQANTFTGLLIFTMLGFGMASPFLVLAAFPKLVAYLPKPGLWMETFKQSMGFLLMAALVFLAYLLGQLAGPAAIVALLALLLVAALAAWIYGRWAAPVKSPRTRGVARLVTLALLVTGIFWGLGSVRVAYNNYGGGPKLVAEGDPWAPWSNEAVEKSLAEGKPVFVDFTASWCLICQVNKKSALHTEATQELFEENGVVSLSADWTRYDPAITEELEKFERSGVPLYLLYSPSGQVSVLPQNLTNGIVREAVKAL